MEDNKYVPVVKGDFVLTQGGPDYVQVPAGEPFKAHISKIDVVQSPTFDNPNVLEDKLAIRFCLDEEIDGEGQIYTNWYRPSLNPKAKLTPLVLSLYNGKVPEALDVTDMLGLPLRIVLTEGVEKNGKNRQYVASYLKPTPAQKKVTVELPEAPLTEEGIGEIFANA